MKIQGEEAEARQKKAKRQVRKKQQRSKEERKDSTSAGCNKCGLRASIVSATFCFLTHLYHYYWLLQLQNPTLLQKKHLSTLFPFVNVHCSWAFVKRTTPPYHYPSAFSPPIITPSASPQPVVSEKTPPRQDIICGAPTIRDQQAEVYGAKSWKMSLQPKVPLVPTHMGETSLARVLRQDSRPARAIHVGSGPLIRDLTVLLNSVTRRAYQIFCLEFLLLILFCLIFFFFLFPEWVRASGNLSVLGCEINHLMREYGMPHQLPYRAALKKSLLRSTHL